MIITPPKIPVNPLSPDNLQYCWFCLYSYTILMCVTNDDFFCMQDNFPDLRESLRSIPLFSELDPAQLDEISSISSIVHSSKHAVLFREGDRYRGFYIVLSGIVKVFKVSQSGKESVVHIVKPFTVFADIPLFEGNDYPVAAECLEDCEMIFVPKEKFLLLMRRDPDLSLRMLAGFAKRMKSLIEKLDNLSNKEVSSRLCDFIYSEVKRSGTENLPEPFIKFSVPKSTIAAYIGTITETLSRTMKKLQDEGIIRVQGKKVFIVDLHKLKITAMS